MHPYNTQDILSSYHPMHASHNSLVNLSHSSLVYHSHGTHDLGTPLVVLSLAGSLSMGPAGTPYESLTTLIFSPPFWNAQKMPRILEETLHVP